MLDLSKEKFELIINTLWNKITSKIDNYYTKTEVDEIISSGIGGFSICEWQNFDSNGFYYNESEKNYSSYVSSNINVTTATPYIYFAISVPYDVETKLDIREMRSPGNAPYKVIFNDEEIFNGSNETSNNYKEYIIQLKKGINTLKIYQNQNNSTSNYLFIKLYKVV